MRPSFLVRAASLLALSLLIPLTADAQLVDRTRAPHTENNAAVQKSLAQQIGAGRATDTTPNSSLFLIRRDPFRSIRRGRQLFQRKGSQRLQRPEAARPRPQFPRAAVRRHHHHPLRHRAALGSGHHGSVWPRWPQHQPQ